MAKNSNLAARICNVQYCETKNAVVSDGSSLVKRNVTFLSGTWLNWYFTPGSYEFEQPYQNGIPPFWAQKLTCFFPGKDFANLTDLLDMTEKKLLLKITLTNGDTYIMGCNENPVLFLESENINSGGTAITFYCNSANKLFELE